jgi:hypothetical protein
MVAFVAIPVLIAIAVVAAILTVMIVTIRTVPVRVIVIAMVQAQTENHTAQKSDGIAVIIVSLCGRSDGQGCGQKSREDKGLVFHAKPPLN